MIKQSFLRNYSLNRLYSQAIDEKNKLKVYYLRQVRKIMQEKREKQKLSKRQKTQRQNQQTRRERKLPLRKKPFQNFILTQCCEAQTPQARLNSAKENSSNRVKADLHAWQMKLALPDQSSLDQFVENERSAIALNSSLKIRNRNNIGDRGKQNTTLSNLFQQKNQKEGGVNNLVPSFDLNLEKKYQSKIYSSKEKSRNIGRRLKMQFTQKTQGNEVENAPNCLKIFNFSQKYRRVQTNNI